MKSDAMADLVCTVNPGDRLFVARMAARGFVDQRLTRFTAAPNTDVAFAHALLNSTLGLFYLEAIGFGRGLGALDLSSRRLKERLWMLDPGRFGATERDAVVAAFADVLDRDVQAVPQEIGSDDRHRLDLAVLTPLGLADLVDDIARSLTDLYGIRAAADD
jgi:hypothetical protein